MPADAHQNGHGNAERYPAPPKDARSLLACLRETDHGADLVWLEKKRIELVEKM